MTTATYETPPPVTDDDIEHVLACVAQVRAEPASPQAWRDILVFAVRLEWLIGEALTKAETGDLVTKQRKEQHDLAAAGLALLASIREWTAESGAALPSLRCPDCDEARELAGLSATCEAHTALRRKRDGLNPYYPVPEKNRASNYGITAHDLQRLYNRAGGRCEVCRNPDVPPSQLVIDHNHASGAVRGLLCVKCNTGLGLMQDNPRFMFAGWMYLETHGSYGGDQ